MLNLQSVYFGQNHKNFDHEDFELIKKIKRLAKHHQEQTENDCNGVGFVKGIRYYSGSIDDYVKREYGYNVKSSYIDNTEETIFVKEQGKTEIKINSLIAGFNKKGYRIEYQGDPRGATVRLTLDGDYIEL